ncbi:MAG: APC family permease [Proteobacteria bacterium]|nr:APC family permease [Pseudomonadota bacterium]
MADIERGAAAAELEALGYRQELRRSLSLFDLVVWGLLFIGPIAPFSVFGFVYNASHGMPALVYAVGLVAMLFTALSYMAMGREFPLSGSVYAYVARGAGETFGFLAGWAILLDYVLLPTLVYVGTATAFHVLFPWLPKTPQILVYIAAITWVNLAGVSLATWVNRVMLALNIAVLVLFLVLAANGLARGTAGAHLDLAPLIQPGVVTPKLIFGALSLAVLSFLGFDAISTLAEEAKGGARDVGRATFLSLTLSAVLFVVEVYLSGLFVLGHPPFTRGDDAATAFLLIARILGGEPFRFFVAFAGAAGSLAAAVVAQAATARILYGMARDGQLPRALAHVSGDHQVPDRGVMLISVVTLGTSLFFQERLQQLTALVTCGAMLGFLALHASVVIHFRGGARGGNLARHLLAPVIGAAIIAYVLWNAEPAAKIGAALWLVLGVLIVAVQKLRGRRLTLGPEL